jgi:hypothetical protein
MNSDGRSSIILPVDHVERSADKKGRLPAAPPACLAARLAPRGRSIGLTLFRLNDTNDVVPTCTPAAFVSVCSKCRWKQPAACLLAGAYQRLWLCGDDGAYGSSHVLDISFSLPLSPLRRLQCERTPHGVLSIQRKMGGCLGSYSTQPLPATPMPIGYCGRNRRFSSLLSC